MTETKGTVLLKSAAELKAYSNSEEESLEAIIKAIADAGTKMIICGQAGPNPSPSPNPNLKRAALLLLTDEQLLHLPYISLNLPYISLISH